MKSPLDRGSILVCGRHSNDQIRVDASIREKLETTVTAIMEVGFNHLFLTAGLLSILVVFAGIYILRDSKH